MSDNLIISGSDNLEEIPRIQVFAVPTKVANPAYRPEGGEGYDPETPEFLSELVPYYMPAEVNPVVGLEYGERSGENQAAASVWIIKEVVGAAAYEALKAEMRRMTPAGATAALKAVSERISTVALGN